MTADVHVNAVGALEMVTCQESFCQPGTLSPLATIRTPLSEATLLVRHGLDEVLDVYGHHSAASLLQDKFGTPVRAGTLWATQPCLVLCVRRPGCMLCRAEAKRLWDLHRVVVDELKVRMVCVLHEWMQTEVEAYSPKFWGGEVYFDHEKSIFAALGGGKIRKGSMMTFLNPFNRVYKNTAEAKQVVDDFNFKGDATVLGGMLIVHAGPGANAEFVFQEKAFGDHAPHDEVISACRRVAGLE